MSSQPFWVTKARPGRPDILVNAVGEPSRGWVDYPGRLWIARANLGAIYSPDGMTIEFDNGTIWQRAPEAPPPRRRRR